MDLYNILGIDKTAGRNDIKNAYRNKVKKCHPDRGGNPAQLSKVIKAYNILSNDIARNKYDKTGEVDEGKKESDRVIERVISLFYSVIANMDLTAICYTNLINIMIKTAENIIEKQCGAIKNLNDNISKFTEIKKRTKKKKKGFNIFKSVIDNDIAKCRAGIKEIKGHQKDTRAAIKFLNDYIYEADKTSTAVGPIFTATVSIGSQKTFTGNI